MKVSLTQHHGRESRSQLHPARTIDTTQYLIGDLHLSSDPSCGECAQRACRSYPTSLDLVDRRKLQVPKTTASSNQWLWFLLLETATFLNANSIHMAGLSTQEAIGGATAWKTSVRKCLYELAAPDII
jgi:hypothetical protein